MWNAFRLLVMALTRRVLPLRYRIRVDGAEQIHGLSCPVLLLPNHPAFIDPAIVLATFYGEFRPRTVLYEGNFAGPIKRLIVKLLQAISVPDLVRPSHEAYERTEQAIAEVIAALKQGQNILLWPSGRTQRDGMERLGPARALTAVLQAVPEAKIVLIRTQGLWGSMFSHAPTGDAPNLQRCLIDGMLLLFANFFFFCPKRKVSITVELIDRGQLPQLEWQVVNRWFEAKYNPDGPESPTYVPYHFLFGPRTYVFRQLTNLRRETIDADQLRPETQKEVADLLRAKLPPNITPEDLAFDRRLDDLGLDSLQRMDLALAVEKWFNVSASRAPETVGELMALAQGLIEQVGREPPPAWFKKPAQVEPLRILGETVPEAFITRALRSRREIAIADDLSGALTYEQLLIGALVMADRFRRLPCTNVGLMLPASVASDIMLYGLYLAGKLPVLLNWTTGRANLQHAVKLTGLTHVVTARQLRDRLGIMIGGVEFVDVEELSHDVTSLEKLRWWLTVRCFPGAIRRRAGRGKPDERAVILFTSGSEKAPKAVPLSHANVISNARAVPMVLKLTNQDSILGFLPMFHSFGFTMTGLCPLLGGLRTIHHPDPTDTAGLQRKIATYKPDIFVTMPSFLDRIFRRARPGDLDSLKIIVVGAEKTPPALFETAHCLIPKATMIEGYGVTECSPSIAANRPDDSRPGSIGRPLPEVEACVVDLNTDLVLPPGNMGMLLIRGPNVFAGYLGEEISPFMTIDGKRWYVTGDLVEMDADGFIYFRGRLKRFVKAGGEMISLPALEDVFTGLYPPDENGPRVAVEGVEVESGHCVVLFTSVPIELDEANDQLARAGFRGMMRLDEVRSIDQLPVLGNGKTDYKQLRAMLEEERKRRSAVSSYADRYAPSGHHAENWTPLE